MPRGTRFRTWDTDHGGTLSKAELNLTAVRPRYERTYCAPPETLVSLQAALRRACFPPTSEHSLVPVGGM